MPELTSSAEASRCNKPSELGDGFGPTYTARLARGLVMLPISRSTAQALLSAGFSIMIVDSLPRVSFWRCHMLHAQDGFRSVSQHFHLETRQGCRHPREVHYDRCPWTLGVVLCPDRALMRVDNASTDSETEP